MPIPQDTIRSTQSGAAFPLPLTPFEKFLWSADSVESPMVFRVAMRMRGSIDAELLSRTFDNAVSRHALLNAVVSQSPNGPQWQIATHAPILNRVEGNAIRGDADINDACVPPPAIDLQQDPGLRVHIVTRSDGILILLDFHHAACDGQGARQLVADWFHAYDHICRDKVTKLTEFETNKLDSRGTIVRRSGVEPIGFKEGLRNFWVTVSGRTARLPTRTADRQSKANSASHLAERLLSVNQTATIRTRLQARAVSINDLGIATSMHVFAAMFPNVKSKHFVTVLNPVDLRLPSDRYLSAANKTGFTYLRRRHRDCRSVETLLQSIRDETTYIKERFVGAEFIHGLTSADRRPWLLKLIRQAGLFTPTLQFTCLGDATRGKRYGFRQEDGVVTLGRLHLEHISGFAPLAPRVPLSITACETNSRLSLTVHSSDTFLTAEQGTAFADAVVAELLNWCRQQQQVAQQPETQTC